MEKNLFEVVGGSADGGEYELSIHAKFIYIPIRCRCGKSDCKDVFEEKYVPYQGRLWYEPLLKGIWRRAYFWIDVVD